MEETKKKKKKNINNEDSKKKERHIVTWTPEEDVILREQITLLGTENWGIIASKFKDKSTRQCRRRWYTYLNSDFKRGGWSPEEDMLLCEAQRVFGNRWTEIAKVVSGRTDNAVKNRFTTLCKKRAKHEAMAKENNSNNKRMLFLDGITTPRKAESEAPIAKRTRRSHIPEITEMSNYGKAESCLNQQVRSPFSVLARNAMGVDCLEEQYQTSNVKESDGEGMFLKKDDPKVTALMQQAELLSSLAQKVNADNTEQSMENAWKVLQDFLNQGKENDLLRYGLPEIDFQLEEFRDLIEDLRSSYQDNHPSWRKPDLHDSPASSEYSSGSTIMLDHSGDRTQSSLPDTQTEHQEDGEKFLPNCDVLKNPKTPDENMPISGEEDFSSPIQVTTLFRSLADGIPSPQFSESERSFLLKTLGIESSSPCPSADPSQPPPCKRVLLHSL